MRRSVITPILLDPPHQAPITLAFDSPFVLNRIFVGTCALILADDTGFIHLTLWENRTGTYSRPGPCLHWCLSGFTSYERPFPPTSPLRLRLQPAPTAAFWEYPD